MSLNFVLFAAAFGCFIIAAFGRLTRVPWLAIGLALWVLVYVIANWPGR